MDPEYKALLACAVAGAAAAVLLGLSVQGNWYACHLGEWLEGYLLFACLGAVTVGGAVYALRTFRRLK
jgi:hypothetical protein